jgi:hypothetical protein
MMISGGIMLTAVLLTIYVAGGVGFIVALAWAAASPSPHLNEIKTSQTKVATLKKTPPPARIEIRSQFSKAFREERIRSAR